MQLVAKRPLELAFLAVWVGYFGLIALAGFQSDYDNFWLAVCYQMLFVVVLVGIYATLPRVEFNAEPLNGNVTPIVTAGLGASLVGIVALFVAKSEAGVIYSTSFCQARYQMYAIGAVGSPLSIFGNLFSYAFFVPTAAVIIMNVSRRLFWTAICASAACLMVLAIVTSSRSTIMIFGAFCVACVCVRLLLGRPVPRVRIIDLVPVALIAALMAAFVLSVFACRAEASRLSASQYQGNFEQYLGMAGEGAVDGPKQSLPNLAKSQETQLAKASGLVGMSVLYLVHSAYTFDGIISLDDVSAGHVLFRYPRQLLARLGVVTPPQNWVLSGRFTSVPGALYHDLGLGGLVLGAGALGALAWVAAVAAKRYSTNVLAVGAAAMFLTILLLSPIHPAQEFMAFPFICVMFLVVPVLAYPFSKPRQ